MAVGLSYTADLVPTVFTNVPTTIFQLTTAGTAPISVHRLELQTNQTGSTQTVLQVQMAIASATGSGGTTVSITPRSIVRKNTVASATTVVAGYTTPGAISVILHTWQWNGATPFDIVFGKDAIVPEVPAGQILVVNFLTAPGTPTVSGTVSYEEM
jgi:hypothetical protein